MPSLRQKVTTYFRQFSFIADREERANTSNKLSDGSFITRYLDGTWKPPDSIPKVLCGKEPQDLPDQAVGKYKTGNDSITAAYTGPDEGLTGVRRKKIHLSAGPEIDFIDTTLETESQNDVGVTKNLPSSFKTTNVRTDSNANKRILAPRDTLTKSQLSHSLTIYKNIPVDCTVSSNKQLPIDRLNENTVIKGSSEATATDPIAGVHNWKTSNDDVYGISVSLYEKNGITGENIGNPVADCFGILTRDNSCIMALADGVNWGEGARLAARCAIQGSIDYLNSAIFGIHQASSTRDIFVSLVRSFWEAHAYIMESGGALTTLTVLVVLPLPDDHDKSVVCCCNVGDSLGYVYSKEHGVREITEGSHDVNSMRDMRDALGALGPVNGDKPEMTNLTLSFTIVEKGDIVFLTSDGISDNFDPVVGKFAEPISSKPQPAVPPSKPPQTAQNRLAPKRQNKSASSIVAARRQEESGATSAVAGSSAAAKPPASSSSSSQRARPISVVTSSVVEAPTRPRYMRSKTFIEPRSRAINQDPIRRGPSLPLVTGAQRHQLTLLRMTDLLMYGINGTLRPCTNAKQLCQLLIDFATCITSAKRKILEQRELYYKVVTDREGHRKEVEYSKPQQKMARKRMVEGSTFSSLPGKLDHASIVAFTVIGVDRTYNETNL
ncbi:PP2C-like domain-containing protein CG9801 [Uranotaenia lowii]|uniref:PP2C-like domain-containing protein CG9801 n=1 Tax=Uranotaenia lowii TaxID=190385 RepID=UPI0024795C3F|nr:PP2C-like domain-containing protein CG9801 [Uranotaenia lowii]